MNLNKSLTGVLVLIFLGAYAIHSHPVTDSLAKAIGFIQKSQNSDGHFDALICSDREMRQCQKIPPNYFFPTFIYLNFKLSSVNAQLDDSRYVRALKAAAPQGIYNYHVDTSIMPNDMDTTILNLNYLNVAQGNLKYPDFEVHFKKINGFFNVWSDLSDKAIPDKQNQDCVVNLRVAEYFKKMGITDPTLSGALHQIIATKSYPQCSAYYHYPLIFDLYLSELMLVDPSYIKYRVQIKNGLKKQMRQQHWGTPLHNALALLIIHHLELKSEFNIKSAIENIRLAQNADGSWPAEAFLEIPAQTKYWSNRKPMALYWGGQELTTSFVIRALSHYVEQVSDMPKKR